VNRYDAAYFDKWYHNPKTRVHTRGDVRRKVRLAVSAAELLLQRPIRSVLDIGCGEGAWLGLLREIRPRVRYTGVDPSEYAVKRFGSRRNLKLGSFDRLDQVEGLEPADLVVCSDMLNYLDLSALKRGVALLEPLTSGLAYLELYAAEDEVEGDVAGWKRLSGREYRKLLRDAGFIPCGMQCYVSERLLPETIALERLD
jgi:SAM-dependent methyltransferase